MDQTPLVDMLKEDGERLIHRLVEEGVGVTAACWLRASVDGEWFLYIATPLVGEDGATKEAYRHIHTVIRRTSPPLRIGPFDVKVAGPESPIATAIREVHRRYPGSSPVYYGGAQFGGLSVEGVYVYPPLPAPVK